MKETHLRNWSQGKPSVGTIANITHVERSAGIKPCPPHQFTALVLSTGAHAFDMRYRTLTDVARATSLNKERVMIWDTSDVGSWEFKPTLWQKIKLLFAPVIVSVDVYEGVRITVTAKRMGKNTYITKIEECKQ